MWLVTGSVQAWTLEESIEGSFIYPVVYTAATFATSKVSRPFFEPVVVLVWFLLLLLGQ